MEMKTYGIKIISESETVSKFPRSITATTVADATKRRSIDISVNRRNDCHPATCPRGLLPVPAYALAQK
jgi:hypothetical protein